MRPSTLPPPQIADALEIGPRVHDAGLPDATARAAEFVGGQRPVPRLLEVAHVAHRLCASQGYVRRLIREGKLAAIRLGTRWRVDPEDLKRFIDAQREPAVPLGARGHRR